MRVLPLKEDSSACSSLIFQKNGTSSLYAYLSKYAIPLPVPPNITEIFGCILLWCKQSLMEQKLFQYKHMSEKNTQVHGYLLYPKCHQRQSHEEVVLSPMINTCEWVNNYTWILGCFNQRNNIFLLKLCGENMSGSADILLYFIQVYLPFCCCVFLSETIAPYKLGYPIIWWLKILNLSHKQVPLYIE